MSSRPGRLEEYVSAAIYSDFLGMAESLLAQQQAELVDIAAFLAGAVLENGLKRIATNRAIKLKDSDDIPTLNHKLADEEYTTIFGVGRLRHGALFGVMRITAALGKPPERLSRIWSQASEIFSQSFCEPSRDPRHDHLQI